MRDQKSRMSIMPRDSARPTLLVRISGLVYLLLLAGSVSGASTPGEYMDDARAYMENGETRAAIIQLKNALQKEPDNVDARSMLAELYLLENEGVAAESEFEKLISLTGDRGAWLSGLGHSYLVQERFIAVVDEIAVEDGFTDRTNAEIRSIRGAAYLGLGRKEEAKTEFDAALSMVAGYPRAKVGLARIALNERDLDEARTLVREALDMAPHSVEAHAVAGAVAHSTGLLGEAMSHFEAVLARAPKHREARVGRAAVHIDKGELSRAAQELGRILEEAPGDTKANYLLGVVYLESGDLGKALTAAQKVLQEYPRHAPTHLLLGQIQFRRGNLSEAARYMEGYLLGREGDVSAAKLLAAIYVKQRKPWRAITVLSDEGQARFADAQALDLLGIAHIRNGNYALGLEYLERAGSGETPARQMRLPLGMGYIASGQVEQVIQNLGTVSDDDVDHERNTVMLALAYLQKRDYERVVEISKELLESGPSKALAHNLMGTAYLGAQEEEKARLQFNKALTENPDFYPAELNIAALDLRSGDLDNAEKHYKAVLSREKTHIGAMVSLARVKELQGEREEALNILEEAQALRPGAIRPGLVLADYYHKAGNPTRAYSIIRELARYQSENPLVLSRKGQLETELSLYKSAEDTFHKLVAIQPEGISGHIRLARVLAAREKYNAARDRLSEVLKREPGNIDALVNMAGIQIKLREYESALETAEKLRKINEGSAIGYELSGDIYAVRGEEAQAIRYLSRAYDREPTRSRALKLHRIYLDAGSKDEAVAALNRWTTQHPEDIKTRIILAVAYHRLGRYTEAAKEYEEILELQPRNATVVNNLAWIYHEKGDDRALAFAQRAYELAPERPDIADTLGWILVENGEESKGLHLLTEAALYAPSEPDIQYHMAMAYYELGNYKKAKRAAESAITLASERGTDAHDARMLLDRIEKIAP